LGLPIMCLIAGRYSLLPLGLYSLMDVYFSIKGKETFQAKAWRLLVYPMLHLGYGSGFLLGLRKRRR
jgi:hypothetical protein